VRIKGRFAERQLRNGLIEFKVIAFQSIDMGTVNGRMVVAEPQLERLAMQRLDMLQSIAEPLHV
jgi:hypothetical protein